SLFAKKADGIRNTYGQLGKHIPPFLVAGITKKGDLHCKGCYNERAEYLSTSQKELSREEWGRIFKEASDLGISMVLLSGEEPLDRRDVLEEAALHRSILFPVFTNGKMLKEYGMLFDENRNLVPVLRLSVEKNAVEGGLQDTFCENMEERMDALKEKGIYFGVSVSVTKENFEEVTGETFLEFLEEKGVGLVNFVEFVPERIKEKGLALEEKDRIELENRIEALRMEKKTMSFIHFPGEEEKTGGCLAAGRGFFFIDAAGGYRPCPFSPYSSCNVKDKTLLEVLDCEVFTKAQ
ncbi:MAG: radical SAM protein, partial [Lachnospiraceae bacterium]|nr:radical SAM protein [Lachnospiraceae bacterium]